MAEQPYPAASPDVEPEEKPIDATSVHGPLHVEKLEGRQETGRDAQDEAEEDESPGWPDRRPNP